MPFRQHVVHMHTRVVGDVGSAETEPWPQLWSPEGSAPGFVTHMAPTQTSGPSGADSPFVAGWKFLALRNHALRIRLGLVSTRGQPKGLKP